MSNKYGPGTLDQKLSDYKDNGFIVKMTKIKIEFLYIRKTNIRKRRLLCGLCGSMTFRSIFVQVWFFSFFDF